MNNEEQFKKSLNDKLDSKEFTFEESDWDSARKLIDESREKKRRFFFYLLFGGIALFTGLVSLFVIPPKNELLSNKNERSLTQNQLPQIAPVAPSEKVLEPEVQKDLISHENKTAKQKTNSSESKTKPTRNELASVKPQQQTRAESSNSEIRANGRVTKTPNAVVVAANTQVSTSINNSKTLEQKEKNNIPVAPLPIEEVETEISSSSIEPTISTQNTQVVQNSSEVVGVAALNLKEETIAPVEEKLPEPQAVNSKMIAPVSVDSMLAPIAAKPDTDYVKRKKPNLSIELGAAYNFGWKSAELKEASGFSPVVGLNYLSEITPKILVGLGIQYGSVSNLKYSSYTSKVSRLSLGEESEVSIYTPNSLQYLIAPIRIEYKYDLSNSFGGGINFGYLLTVKSDLETYTQTFSGISNVKSQKVTGYNEGFNKYDLQLSAFYRRKLMANFYAKAEFFLGLNTIKDNSFFPSQTKGKNTGIKLTLMYDIFKNY